MSFMNLNGSRFSLNNQRVLVTGASRGLGAEIASLLAAAGADLVISGRDPIGLENTRQVVERFGHHCHPVQTDLSSIEETHRLADQALGSFLWKTC